MKKIYLIRLLAKVKKSHLKDLEMISRNWISYQRRPRKLKVKKFKENMKAGMIGWKTRKIIKEIKAKDEIRELLDCIRLDIDMWKEKGEGNIDGF